jgi:hypothetical protein
MTGRFRRLRVGTRGKPSKEAGPPAPALLCVLFSALRVETALENADDIPDSLRWWFNDRAS